MAKKQRRMGFLESILKSYREYREEKEDELDDDDFVSEDDYVDDDDDLENSSTSTAENDKDKKKKDDKKDNEDDEDNDKDKKKKDAKKDNEEDEENDTYSESHGTRCSLDDFDEEADNWKDGIPVGHVIAGAGVIAIGAIIVMGGYSLVKMAKKGIIKEDEDKTTEITTEATTEYYDPTTEEFTAEIVAPEEVVEETKDITQYGDMANLLENANLSEEKKTAISKVWSYISYYNTTVANQNIEEGNPNKLAISWDEAMAQYLIYNGDIQNPATICAIFDMYKLSPESLKNDFENSTKLDYEAYHILNQPTSKSVLFADESAIIYDKFEDTISKFNSTSKSDVELRESIANRFNSDIRGDFNLAGNYSFNDPYKMQMLPLTKAMFEMMKGINSETKLTKHEKKQLKKVDNVDDIIANICYYKVDTVTEDEFSYEDIRNFAIQQLINAGAYNLENRDVTTYAKYQASINTEEQTEKDSTEMTTEEQTTSSEKTSVNNETTESKKKSKKKKQKTEKIDDDDKSDEIPAWMLEENNKNNKEKKSKKKKEETNTNSETNNNDGYIDEDVPEVQPDTPDVSYNNKVINSSVSNISNDMMQKYFNAVATAIVENMANNTVSKEIVKVKTM